METKKLSFDEMEGVEGGGCSPAVNKTVAVIGGIGAIAGFAMLGVATGGLAWGILGATTVLSSPATVTGLLCAFT
ncbi:MAG TPA: hypothetical protein VE912_06670 [Bacteroidales bacterium]|nr:hypothetical protein [Bacteroidales bacterium]